MALAECCRDEARVSLRRGRDIAVCDGCGSLLLAYDDENTQVLTAEELRSKGANFDSERIGELWVIAKRR